MNRVRKINKENPKHTENIKKKIKILKLIYKKKSKLNYNSNNWIYWSNNNHSSNRCSNSNHNNRQLEGTQLNNQIKSQEMIKRLVIIIFELLIT